MVVPGGFEPPIRSDLELAVYKTAVLPLNYGTENLPVERDRRQGLSTSVKGRALEL